MASSDTYGVSDHHLTKVLSVLTVAKFQCVRLPTQISDNTTEVYNRKAS